MLDKAYDPKAVEDKIYDAWEKSGAFKPESCDPNGEPFTISMPPPNATGQLHLGHAVMLALEDIFIRFARMRGKKTLWIPGTDHAAIATENVVIKQLKDGGMKDPRKELGREKLVKKIAEFVELSKNTIRGQVRKMGSSCDWSRERYTFEPSLNRCVNEVFKKMHADGLIYRGHRIVNWDPKLQTTVSDDEVDYKEEKGAFYTFKYGPFEIATARPETKFGDKYVVMHPKDKRYSTYKHGETFDAEWINGPVRATVIKDESIDMEFGTGVMTITPWHDKIDFEIADRHGLEKEQVIGFDGRLLDIAGEFKGMKIEEARPLIVEKLKLKGLLVKSDDNYVHNKAVSQRGGGSIEPQIKLQWFIDVNKEVVPWSSPPTPLLAGEGRTLMSLKQIMHSVIHHGDIKVIPDRFEKTYFHWIDNLRDWCISRQIWWGHRIPVWYGLDGKEYLRPQQHFILARHGESVGNKNGIVQGHHDELSPAGEKHAKDLAHALRDRSISKVVSSRSIRALRTAEIVAKELGISAPDVWDDLNQIDLGTITGLPEIPEKPAIERAIEGKTGESLSAFFDRAKNVWNRMQQERSEGTILVVSHRTNLSALDAVREGKNAEHVLEKRRMNEGAAYGVWGEVVLPEGTQDVVLRQDPDTLDTWFSSALWTWSTLIDSKLAADPKLRLEEILKNSSDFQTFHPTAVMETGYDILFFWVARMILMTTYATGQIPFKTVYLHGLIRTRDGKKMSKSHPETMIDPLDMISTYGADALRLSMIVGQSPGADSRLYEEKIAGYRNFINKLWNASRFVLMQCEQAGIDPTSIEKLPELGKLSLADRAILHASEILIEDVTKGLETYALSETGEKLYSFTWDYFCDWYLELSKGTANHTVLIHVLRRILTLLHPYCPFVTEELWSHVAPKHAPSLISAKWPEVKKERKDPKAFAEFQVLIDVITAIRRLRTDQGVEPGTDVTITLVSTKYCQGLEEQESHIRRLAKVGSLTIVTDPVKPKNAASAFLADIEIHLSLEGLFDPVKLKASLEKEQAELTKYVSSVKTKLDNKSFVDRAPKELVNAERQKCEEAEEKLAKICQRLKSL